MKKAIGYVICGVSCFTIGSLYTMLMAGGASVMDEIYGTDHCKDALRPYKKIFRKIIGFDDI